MNRWTVLIAAVVMCMLVAVGCSGGDGDPVAPASGAGITDSTGHAGQSQTHLWGYYDVYIDIENQTVEAIPNRDVMFAANVVQFLNNNPAGLVFNIIDTPIGPDYIDVTIDVSITHPLPGMPQYDGYDVRGVFVGDGAASMDYSGSIRYSVSGTDQYVSNADGYTRWYNQSEFPYPGLMGYTPGAFASIGFMGNATCNPYKYFANGLNPIANYWTFLTSTPGNGKFASGTTNTRRYEIRFPNSKGVAYGYSVVANWESEDPSDHPSNADEAVGCQSDVDPGIWYVDGTNNGGDLILDFDIFNWGDQPTGITIECEEIGGSYSLSPAEMVPTGVTGEVATYHVEIPANNVTDNEPSEYWVIPEYDGVTYTSAMTPPGGAPNATLAAFFRFELYIHDDYYNRDPDCSFEVVTPMPHVGNGEIEFDAALSSDPDGDTLTYHWDFDGDGNYDESPDDDYTGTPVNPTHAYEDDYQGDVCLLLEDGNGGESECCETIDVTILIPPDSYPCPVSPSTYDSDYELTSGYTILPAADDGCIFNIPIGFTFSYGTFDYTTVTIVRNGGLGFGSDCFSCCTPYCTTTSMVHWITAVGDDLNSSAGGMMRYQVKTVNSVQCFILEFYDVPAYYISGQNTFQIVLFDTPQDQYDDFLIQVQEVYWYDSDVFYRYLASTCCLSTYMPSLPAAWSVPGEVS